MVSRRSLLLAPAAPLIAGALFAAAGRMSLAMHQNTAVGRPFRESLAAWSRAGIRQVEILGVVLDEFLKTENLASARRVLSDLGLTPVSSGAGLTGLWEPDPNRPANLETLKRRCGQFAELGIDRIVCPTTTSRQFAAADYQRAIDNARENGEIGRQFHITVLLEFSRFSTFIATLPTALQITRGAAHANVRPMLDCFHFWAGMSKFEDLDLLRPGEIAHVHFQDTPDEPRESIENTSRVIPGDGIAPLARILRKLADKGYSGPLSVELLAPEFREEDQYQLARRIRTGAEPILHRAHVA
jgi:2-keto-myo-inositol isomerase